MSEPARPTTPQYKGEDLDAARGPGLGCFWSQVVLLAVTVVLTPVSAFAGWPPFLTVALMIVMIVLLLLVGQTAIFLLRIVAAERGQRRPLASRTRTVGEIEAGQAIGQPQPGAGAAAPGIAAPAPGTAAPASGAAKPGEPSSGRPVERLGTADEDDSSGMRE